MINYDFFPGMHLLKKDSKNEELSLSKPYTRIFNSVINLIELSLQIFIISTVRIYENRIVVEADLDRKKISPIKDLLKNKFAAPTLGTQASLARHCTYLIDADAPVELIQMKERLNETVQLNEIGRLLNDLDKIFEIIEESDNNKAKVVNRESTKKTLLKIIDDFIKFRNDSSHLKNIANVIEDNFHKLVLDISLWNKAFIEIVDLLKPMLCQKYNTRVVDKILTENGAKMILVKNKIYHKGQVYEYDEKISLVNWYDEQWNDISEIIFTQTNGEEKSIDLFPFLLFFQDKLFYYKKTKSSGYQYFSPIDEIAYTVQTKKKFNHNVFRSSFTSSTQALFWTEVLPAINPKNNIKANIPHQGNTQFIGRKKQLSKIREEIIEIPNQNGILYGPGGVGKTALLIELSKQLYERSHLEDVLYDNIIWISAKTNFYNWEQNATVSRPQQFESLENVLQIMLRFFDCEDVDEYNLDELKELVFELVEESKILLILDNFETVAKSESDKIISFFGSDIKKHLKALPNNFKVILTSRELIPSGYYQIKLEGLELRESIMLMESIYEKYKNGHVKLSDQQCRLLHEATFGIPIVIKHCLGQVFEFNEPLSDILARLSHESNEVIKFSYSEIFSHLKKDDCYLKILILLEALNEPLSSRQIATILELPLHDINKHIPTLSNFQCLDKINIGIEERYKISKQVGLLAKGLIKEHVGLVASIREHIAENLTLEKRMDYAIEEFEIIEIFNGYIEVRDFAYAEHFLKNEIYKRPSSQLLRFNHALFLRDRKKDVKGAIALLEILDKEIAQTGKHDANILLTLANTYTALDFAEFDKANNCYNVLLKNYPSDQMSLFAGEFYINWSTALKDRKELDPFEEKRRKNKISELAELGIKQIEGVQTSKNQHKYLHLIAQGHYNQWDTEKAKVFLNRAIDLAQKDLISLRKYEKFMNSIMKY